MDIKDVFEQLGLTEEHLKVYLASLEWGETTVSNLSYKSKLPRTSVYLYLEDLINLGLIKPSLKGKKKEYIAQDPEYLLTLLKRKKFDVENLILKVENSMSQLKSMQNNRKDKPKVHFLEGPEGIKQAYEMSLEAKEEVLVQCYCADYEDVVSEKFFESYFTRFFKLPVKSKELITNTKEDEEYIKRWTSDKNLHLMVDISSISDAIETDLMLFDGKVIFVSFSKESPYALVIEDESIFNALKSMYQLSWNDASVKDKRVKNGKNVKTEY